MPSRKFSAARKPNKLASKRRPPRPKPSACSRKRSKPPPPPRASKPKPKKPAPPPYSSSKPRKPPPTRPPKTAPLPSPSSVPLKPGAREKLAKISGIVLAHPGLSLQIEGHTDSVGGDDFNQQLSERRADSVRDFLAEQGVSASSITARGFGKTQPVASNDTPEGRQRNRRVELVVNGDAIGNTAVASAAPVSQR